MKSLDVVVLTHPERLGSASMPRFASMLADGLRHRGHQVELWRPPDRVSGIPRLGGAARKWAGYVDDYLIFRMEISRRVRRMRRAGRKPVFVISDHALGMLVPALVAEPHVIHCHDFLAQRSAAGEFPENPTGASGRAYQTLIRRGYSRGHAFLSISQATRNDLHHQLGRVPAISEVVYNGLNFDFGPVEGSEARDELRGILEPEDGEGFLLHVGGNQWYKNRSGVIGIYEAYRRKREATGRTALPLWMIGPPPSPELAAAADGVSGSGRVRFVCGLNNAQVRAAYNLARALVFPSLEEGFGWPPLEAMACGTPVMTTRQAPMTEVGGDAVVYLDRMPADVGKRQQWCDLGADLLGDLLEEDSEKRAHRRTNGFRQAAGFDAARMLDRCVEIYRHALES